MPDRVTPGPIRSNQTPREAVCVHTKKVYDSCRDKECLQDVRVYLTRGSQQLLNSCLNVKVKSAELLWAYVDVEPISFNKGFYTVDVKYFYKITAEAYSGVGRPREIVGLATFDKRTVLFGSEGSSKIFTSLSDIQSACNDDFSKINLPVAVVEVVDPVCLSAKIVERDCCGDYCLADVPGGICNCFDDDLVVDDSRALFVSLGQFSIIRLERDIQLVMPAYDINLPQKECIGSADPENPCDLFEAISFPVDEFFPPKMSELNGTTSTRSNRSGGCGSCSR